MKSFRCIHLALTLCAHLLAPTSANSEADQALINASLGDGGDEDSFVDAAKEALKNGANIDAKEPASGQTTLMAASLRGRAKLVKFLLEEGADPTIPEGSGYLPPHGAGFQGRPEVMKVLIDAGIDVNVYHERDGFLPLHRACWGREKGHAETLRVLIQHGIPYDVKSKDGKTCQDMAQSLDILTVLDEESEEDILSGVDKELYKDYDDDFDDDDAWDDDDDDYEGIDGDGDVYDDDDGDIYDDDDDGYEDYVESMSRQEL